MTMDKELYKRAYESYREWNEIELADRVRNRGKLTPQEAWKQYVALWQLAMKLSPPMSEAQSHFPLQEKIDYIEKVKKMEAWRRAHGR